MRRFFFSLLATTFLGTVMGCCGIHHISGVCDCDPDRDWCNPYGCGHCSNCNGNYNGGGSVLEPSTVPAITNTPAPMKK
jgi:hypothetical protein